MSDLDRFKRINDERGHQTGDEVLRRFAALAKVLIRPSDWIARYGGEEFVIVSAGDRCGGGGDRCGGRFARNARRRRCRCASGDLAVTSSFGVVGVACRVAF